MHYAIMGTRIDKTFGLVNYKSRYSGNQRNSVIYFYSHIFPRLVVRFHSHETLTMREKSFVKPFNQALAVGSLLYSRNKVSAGQLAFLHNNTKEYEPEKMTASPITMSIFPAKKMK